MRAFIALKIPDAVKEELIKKTRPFAKDIKGRFVGKDALHITLKFLGEISEGQAEMAYSIIREASEKFAEFEASLREAGAFPFSRARILWAGVGDGCDEIKKIAEFVSKRVFKKLEIQKDRKEFIPHLTLCRLKAPKVPEEFFKLDFDLKFRVRSIHLIKSILDPSGARYSDIACFDFVRKTNGRL